MNNSELARNLYQENKTDPKEYTLMPFDHPKFKDKDTFYGMILGIMINQYAMNEFEEDWIPYTRERFQHLKKREFRKVYKRILYRLEKSGIIETKEIENVRYVRIIDDSLFLPDLINE